MKALVLALSLTLTAWAQTPNRAEVELQAAINKETIEGNLRSAIDLYRKVAAQHRANRSVASRALLRLAEAQEKLGEANARQAYEQILRDYADQQPASVARTRLAALGQAGSPMTARRLMAPPPSWWTGTPNPLSADGRTLFVAINENGNWLPALLDLTTNQTRQLPKPAGSGYIDSGVLSADNRLLAFTPQPSPGLLDLTIANADGSQPRAILRTSSAITWLYPLGFTPGNRALLIQFNIEGQRGYHLGRVDLSSGAMTALKKFPDERLGQARVSPDGQWVVFAAKKPGGSQDSDLYTIRTDGSEEHVLVEHAASDMSPVWTADGSGVLFLTNRRGSLDLWHVPVHAGKPAGEERMLKPDIGNVDLMGCNRQGALIYRASAGSVAFFHSTIDATSGRFRAFQELKESYAGQKLRPRISPDEKLLAYVRRPDYAKDQALIGIRNLETGKERELLVPGLRLIGWVAWLPGQRQFLAAGITHADAAGIYLIDAQSGEAKALPPSPNAISGYAPGGGTPVVAPDGKTGYFPMFKVGGIGGALVARDLQSGAARLLLETRGYFNHPLLSPDGRWLAYQEQDGAKTITGKILSLTDNSIRDLPAGITVHGWSSDSQSVYVISLPDSLRESGGKKQLTFFRMPREGGALQPVNEPLDYSMADSEQLLGRTAIYRSNRQMKEIWSLDHALPAKP